jgi:hypothetical protein
VTSPGFSLLFAAPHSDPRFDLGHGKEAGVGLTLSRHDMRRGNQVATDHSDRMAELIARNRAVLARAEAARMRIEETIKRVEAIVRRAMEMQVMTAAEQQWVAPREPAVTDLDPAQPDLPLTPRATSASLSDQACLTLPAARSSPPADWTRLS